MKCPSCNKFAAYDTSAEPECDLEVEVSKEEGKDADLSKGEAHVTGTVRIVLTAECCGDELKEATFDVDEQVDVAKHVDCACLDEWADGCSVEVGSNELTERQDSLSVRIATRGPNKGKEIVKQIPARYQKRFFGVALEFAIQCTCGKEIGSGSFADEIQASGMDELA